MELAALLARVLPQVDALVRQAIGNIRSDGRLTMAEALRQYVSPHLPALIRPYLTAATLRALVRGLQFAYDTWVKPHLGK